MQNEAIVNFQGCTQGDFWYKIDSTRGEGVQIRGTRMEEGKKQYRIMYVYNPQHHQSTCVAMVSSRTRERGEASLALAVSYLVKLIIPLAKYAATPPTVRSVLRTPPTFTLTFFVFSFFLLRRLPLLPRSVHKHTHTPRSVIVRMEEDEIAIHWTTTDVSQPASRPQSYREP